MNNQRNVEGMDNHPIGQVTADQSSAECNFTLTVVSRTFAVAFALLLLLPCVAKAHDLGQSYLFLSMLDNAVGGRFEINVKDANRALGLGFDDDSAIVAGDVDAHVDAISAYFLERVRLAPNGTEAAPRINGHGLRDVSFGQFVLLEFTIDELPQSLASIDIDYEVMFDIDPEHRAFLVVENNWKTATFNNEANYSLAFRPGETRLQLDLSESSLWRGFAAMLELGAHHIWVGIDHIMFLLALLLPSVMRREQRRWQPVAYFKTAFVYVVKIVTVFTVAHTITLSLATLELVVLPSRLVESVIAISIAIAAIDVIYPLFGRHIWWVVFAFGLFHGFGFAGVLAEMGIAPDYIVLTLLGFNLGVEAGQLAIVAVAFPLLYAVRQFRLYPAVFMHGAAAGLVAVSLYWFVERAFEVDLPAGELAQRILDTIA